MPTLPVQTDLEAKEERLRELLAELPSLIVALSGGTDSAFLAWMANEALGTSTRRPFDSAQGGSSPSARNHERVLAVTALSPSFPESERRGVEEFVRRHGIRHQFIETEELANPFYVVNSPDRCYHCKDELFTQLDALARERGFAAVAYGVNLDDQGDFRPGQQAAREHRVLTPLLDAGLTKAEIRELSRQAGLETWDKPAAACLASRIAHGIAVTEDNLKKVERAEEALRALGFRQVRVRYHGKGEPGGDLPTAKAGPSTALPAVGGIAPLGMTNGGAGGLVRIEIAPDELPRALAPEMAAKIRDALKPLGFKFITLDLEGYRQGSFNPRP